MCTIQMSKLRLLETKIRLPKSLLALNLHFIYSSQSAVTQ